MRVMFAYASAAVLSAGCGSPRNPQSLPLAPDPIRAPTAPSGASVGGVVTAVGNSPAAGARVVVMGVDWPGNFAGESTATTDANGQYSMPDVQPTAWAVWHLIGASKPGYFADFIWWMDFPKAAQFNLELDPWAHIAVGEVIQGRVGKALCAGLGYGGWYGRERFALTVPRSGTLNVTLSAPVFNFDLDVVTDGMFAGYAASSGSPLQLSVRVEAGLTYEIRVAAVGPAHDFMLTTELR
jgi:hypothetical protein